MEQKMKAVVRTNAGLEIQNVPIPLQAEAGHLLVKMECCAVNPGDLAFISRPLPPGSVISKYDVYGVSGAGNVIAAGEGVPKLYDGKKVTMYRSLKASRQMIGTWCRYAHIPYLDCAIIPDDAPLEAYSGSMVNIMTPFAFLKQIMEEGHKGIISTAGTSATGIAMAGICQAYDFPLISIVRNDSGKEELEKFSATNIIVQDDVSFKETLTNVAAEFNTTAIFDGVGGEILNKIIESLPNNSTIFSYGYLGDSIPLTVHLRTLTAKGISIRPFGNIRTKTVQEPGNLEKAIKEIAAFIHQPHFKTKVGEKFQLDEIASALSFVGKNGAKAVLCP